jgi:hypothetical protein
MSAVLAVAGCGKKKSSVSDGLGEGASITISGQLALENSSTAAALNLADLNAASNLDVDALKVYCVSFAFPPKAGTGEVDGSGNFSLNIEANGVSIGCFILNGTDTVATMVFEDTSSKNVDGNAKSDARLAFSGNTSMGTIKVDTATGKAKADVANFKSAVKAFSGSGFDFTGTWKLKAADNLPEGYQTAIDCAPGGRDCEGPAKGMDIYLKRISGKKTSDNSDAYAMGIWKSKIAFENCGQKLGFKNDDAKAKVGIDFSSSGLGDGPFTWSSGWEEGWKSSSAKTTYPIPNCAPDRINDVEVMKCKGTANGALAYSVNVNSRDSGCRYEDGSPVEIKNWHDNPVNWGSNQCSDFAKIPALKVCSNTGTLKSNGKTITCKGIHGIVNGNGDAVTGYTFTQDPAYDGACSSAGSELQRLQCYANYYHQNRDSGDKCIADVHLNWGAKDASQFVMRGDGPQRSTNQFVMNLLTYTSDTTAAVHDEKTYFRGVPAGSKDGGQMFINCRFAESVDMALNKLSDTEVLIELVMTQKSVDQNPVCNTETGGSAGFTQKFMFKADKQ